VSGLTTIGFDADDTLWQNEQFFRLTEAHFASLLEEHAEKDHLLDRLLEAEKRNLAIYGFGIKGFTVRPGAQARGFGARRAFRCYRDRQ